MLEELHDTVRKMQESNILVLVEGKKDRAALQAFGLRNIQLLNKPIFQVVEELTAGKCSVLTDFDREGKLLYGKLAGQLRQRGVKVDDTFRNLLMSLPLKQVEGLPSLVHKTYKSPRHQLEW